MSMKFERLGTGSVVPLITPLNPDETVDLDGVVKLVAHQLRRGTNGLFPMGTSGEFARLLPAQQERLLEAVSACNGGESALYIGVGGEGTQRVIQHMKDRLRYRPDAFVCTLPYYYKAVTVREQLMFFSAVAQASQVPLVLYNIPGRIGNSIHLEILPELAASGNIVAFKDSSGDKDYLLETIRRCEPLGIRVLTGAEGLAAFGYAHGASGIVPSLGNPYPGVFVKQYEAAVQGDTQTVEELQTVIDQINRHNKMVAGSTAVVGLRKVLMERKGICGRTMTSPWAELPETLTNQVILEAEALERYE